MDYSHVRDVDPAAAGVPDGEVERQRGTLAMTTLENHVSETTLEAQGSALTDRCTESYPGKCYYANCECADDVEIPTIERTRELWGTEYVNVQPRSGTQANMGVYLTMLDPGDRILSSNLTHGSHLSHGYSANFTGKLYDAEQYEADAETGHIDYDQLVEKIAAFESDIIVSGYSTYPRTVEWETIQEVADDVDVLHLADVTRIAGLVAVGVHPSPVGVASSVTDSVHKTIRAGRDGIIMRGERYASDIGSAISPDAQDGPLMHNIAGKAVGFKETLQPEFEEYAQQAIDNAKTLAKTFEDHGLSVVFGGTNMHPVLVDLRGSHPDLTGGTAKETFGSTGVVLNANTVSGGICPVFNPSGIRAGMPGLTTHGFGEDEIHEVGELIVKVVDAPEGDDTLAEAFERVQELRDTNPLYEQATFTGGHCGPTFGFSNPSPE